MEFQKQHKGNPCQEATKAIYATERRREMNLT